MTGTASTHHKRRQRLRRKLLEQGMPADQVDRILVRMAADQRRSREHATEPTVPLVPLDPEVARFQQLVAEHGLDRARDIVYAEAPDQPDDSSYRPRYVDPVLRGSARATGDTARSVRARRGLAQWETSG